MPWESIAGKSVGVWWGGKEGYKLDADLIWTQFLAPSKHLSPRTIAHFYVWDTDFGNINTDEGMKALLARLTAAGVRYVVQTDLSSWYFMPEEQRRAVVRRNFRNLELTLDAGCVPLLNFNAIFDDDFDYYRAVLPRQLYTVVYDMQHMSYSWRRGKQWAEVQTLPREAQAINLFLKHFEVERMLLVTGRRRITLQEQTFIFTPFRRLGVEVVTIPTEMTKLKLKHDRWYGNKGEAVNRTVAPPPDPSFP